MCVHVGACLCFSYVPDIGHGGEHAVFQGLRRHPAHREQTLAPFPIVVRLIDVPGHAEVWRGERERETFYTVAYYIEYPSHLDMYV